ncbi:MAG: hypothetical protein WC966_00555 [Bradymonadales bacterium]
MNRDEYSYCQFFCEENILLLYEQLRKENAKDVSAAQVLYLSNPARSCVICEQNLGAPPRHLVCWDYHVVLFQPSHRPKIWDFDSRLGLCTDAIEYFTRSFPPDIQGKYRARFRVIDAEFYRENFSSERNLITPKQKREIVYPSWPKFRRGSLSLERCIDFEDKELAPFLDWDEFLSKYVQRSS